MAPLMLALLVASTVHASSILALAPAELFERADRVLYGVVEDLRPLADGGVEVRLRVERTLGDDPDAADREPASGSEAESVAVRFGLAPGDAAIADLPRPTVGDRVLWALRDDDRTLSPVVGFWQGAWTVAANGLADLRGRRLLEDDGVLRIAADAGDEAATSDVGAVLDALDDALRGRDATLDEAPTAAAPGPSLPEVPALPGSASTERAPAPREVALALPDDPQLRAALEAALALWSDAGVPLVLRVDPQASDVVTIRDGAVLGTGVRALLRRRDDGTGVELLLPPGSRGRRPDALAQAIGRLLGLPPTAVGFASGLLPSSGVREPDEAAAAALTRRLAATLGDLDGDGDVDLYDLAAVAEAYGREGIALAADLDGSGQVDAADVELLRERYEFLPASPQPPPQ